MKDQKSLISFILAEKYTLLKKLGEGTFACVYSARNNDKDEMVAIKQVYVQRALLDEAMEEVIRLSNFENDHIISYKDSFYDSQEFYLNMVMQLCQDSLRGQMQDRRPFDSKGLQSFLIQMTCAFLELQNQMTMHLDLKPENILVANKEGTYYKLCDFGCSQISNVSRMSGYEVTAFGTFNYLAPEMHVSYQGQKTRNSADMWSLGVTLYEMIFWKLPFSKDSNGTINRKEVELFFKKQNFTINFDAGPEAPKYIIDIVKLMLKPIPTDRITWKQLKEHLIKNMNVDRHEFLNIRDLIVNFIKIYELLVKAAKLLRQCESSPHPFWKTEKPSGLKFYEELVHYLHIIGLKFKERNAYRWEVIYSPHRQAAEKLIKEVQAMEIAICTKKQIREFDSNDFSYQECVMLDEMKAFKNKLVGQGKTKGELEFLYAAFNTLGTIIQKSQGVFTSLEPFDPCFHIKI